MNIVNQINDCCQDGTFIGSTGYLVTDRIGGLPSSRSPIKLRDFKCLFKSRISLLMSPPSREFISQEKSLNPD